MGLQTTFRGSLFSLREILDPPAHLLDGFEPKSLIQRLRTLAYTHWRESAKALYPKSLQPGAAALLSSLQPRKVPLSRTFCDHSKVTAVLPRFCFQFLNAWLHADRRKRGTATKARAGMTPVGFMGT